VPKKTEPYKVGDRIQISLNGCILDAVIRAIPAHTDGLRLQVDFGNEQTALVTSGRWWKTVRVSIRERQPVNGLTTCFQSLRILVSPAWAARNRKWSNINW